MKGFMEFRSITLSCQMDSQWIVYMYVPRSKFGRVHVHAVYVVAI